MLKSVRVAISLLTLDERRQAVGLLQLIGLRGFVEMLSVGLIFPFLSVLGNPGLIHENSWLIWAYSTGGFESDEGFIFAVGAVFIAVLFAATLIKVATVWLVSNWLELCKHSLAMRLLSYYLAQPYEQSITRHSGDLLSSMLAESARVVGDVIRALADAAQSLVSILFLVGLLFVVNPTVTVLAILIYGGIYAGLLMLVKRTTGRFGTILYRENASRYRVATEALRASKLARSLNRESALVRSFEPHSHLYSVSNARATVVKQLPRFAIELTAVIGIVAVALVMVARDGVGGRDLANALPLIGVFALAVYRMLPAAQRAYTTLISIRLSHEAAINLAKDIAAAKITPPLPTVPIQPISLTERMEFRDVSFAYPQSERKSLDSLNFSIAAHSTVGIVGKTGAGKTTLMDLILGLISPTEGEILLDGSPLKGEGFRALRASAGYIPQETFLSDASIAANIAFGIPADEIDMDKVRRAAQQANIAQFIETLPKGFNTMAGELGVRFSGGQRQRIGIARALYNDPKIVAFDEATSALDTQTEAEVMQAISGLSQERTIIMITHRISTVRNCDVIFVMEDGNIARAGTFEEIAGPVSDTEADMISGLAGA
ncbi:MAG: ABC transporter ATP-binding protein [Pseudomonadota bacterium]